MKRNGKFYVYIVECRGGTYYTGSTNNIENRIKLHNSGHGAKYLRGKVPVELVYAKEFRYYKNALRAEIAIKKLSHKEKEEFAKRLLLQKKAEAFASFAQELREKSQRY